MTDDAEDRECSTDADNQAALHDAVEEVAADAGLTFCETALGAGLSVVEAVQADGSTTFWIIDSDAPPSGLWRPSYAPHELGGPLPRDFKQRTGLTCAATRTNGKPCQQTVKQQGGLCHFHAESGGDR